MYKLINGKLMFIPNIEEAERSDNLYVKYCLICGKKTLNCYDKDITCLKCIMKNLSSKK